jgi:hypothetical protein
MKSLLRTLAATALLSCAACNALSPLEQQQYQNLIDQGAEPVEEKNPTLAGGLNLVLGFGDIYNGEWGAFVLDLLLWVPSVVWAVPQGVVTANNINKKATIAYYTVGDGRDRGFDANRTAGAPPRIEN